MKNILSFNSQPILAKKRIFLPDLPQLQVPPARLACSSEINRLYCYQTFGSPSANGNGVAPSLFFYASLRGYFTVKDLQFHFRLPHILMAGENHYWNLFSRQWLSSMGMFRLRLRVVGSGTYFFAGLSPDLFGVVTGTSHSFFFNLKETGVFGLISGRKKRVLILQGSSLPDLYAIGTLVCRQRMPDAYKGKGLRFLYQKLVLKTGKKKFV
jgi:hypothetical protein